MDANVLFEVCSAAVLPAWLLLALAPGWKWTDRLVHAVWIPGLLCLAYGLAIFLRPEVPEGAGFGSLDGVMLLLGSPYGTLIAWLHFLAFDIFVGAWIARDAARFQIHHLVVIPSLALAFLFGPLGLLLYVFTRFCLRRIVTLREGASSKGASVEPTLGADGA